MDTGLVVDLARRSLEAALWMAGPLLLVAVAVSLLISIGQVLTSLQDQTLSTVPRLAAVGAAVLLLTPWMVRRLGWFTIALFSDFRPYLR